MKTGELLEGDQAETEPGSYKELQTLMFRVLF
jgi:hypothetical protein